MVATYRGRLLSMYSLVLCLALISAAGACNRGNSSYTLATAPAGAAYSIVGEGIATVARSNAHLELRILADSDLGSIVNCRKLLHREVDFAIAQNDAPYEEIADRPNLDPRDLRTVLPLYPEFCFIIYPDSLAPSGLRELITGRRIGIGPATSGTARFMKRLFAEYGIDTTMYTPVYTSFADNILCDSIDVSCAITGYNNPKIPDLLLHHHGRILSLDDYTLADRGSSVEGFCLNYPRAHPIIIPRNTYGDKPDQPILTVAVDAVLLTHRDTDPALVYDLVESILRNKPELSNHNPLLGWLSDNFDRSSLNFTLHEGTRQYLERDQPGYLERNAEFLGLLLSLAVVIWGAYTSLRQWNRQRRKDRIDVYYAEVITIEQSLPTLTSASACRDEITRIRELKHHAYDQLIAEKLSADDSFRIFITLANEVVRRLERQAVRIERRGREV